MKYSFAIIFVLVSICAKAQIRLGDTFNVDSTKITLTSKLGIPFGKMAKLQVEVYDGERLKWKAYEGTYLFKINAINGKKLNDTLILRFTDETARLAKLNEKYVGKKYTVMAYETGQFKGTPDKYFDYTPPVPPGVPIFFATRSFYFEHALVIVSYVTNKK